MHTLWDFSFLISAGPFAVMPFPTNINLIIEIISIVYAVYIVRNIKTKEILKDVKRISRG